jgi:SAM-dependent methyltransferase
MSERHDAYRHLASHYDYHRCDWYAAAFGPRLFSLLETRGFARSRILDAGCGTGTLALAFAGRGYEVTGLDLSESMLEVARKKDPGSRVRWVRGDVTSFELSSPAAFDVITCVGDTLNHLATLDEWEQAFRGFAHRLRPGGVLYADVLTLRGLERLDHYAVTDFPDRALLLGFIFEPESGRSTMKLTSFVPSGDRGLFERVSETVTEWGQPVDGIMDRLRRSGFDRIERLWNEAADPEEEERLTLLAVQREDVDTIRKEDAR